jgi:hypothetical protein
MPSAGDASGVGDAAAVGDVAALGVSGGGEPPSSSQAVLRPETVAQANRKAAPSRKRLFLQLAFSGSASAGMRLLVDLPDVFVCDLRVDLGC